MSVVISFDNANERFVPAERGWCVVFASERGGLLTFPVIFWKFSSLSSRGKSIAPAIRPMACVNDDHETSSDIEDAAAYETYLGVLGPDEDIERYRKMAVGAAIATYGTSALEMLAETGEETE